jgi:hypothetical protein
LFTDFSFSVASALDLLAEQAVAKMDTHSSNPTISSTPNVPGETPGHQDSLPKFFYRVQWEGSLTYYKPDEGFEAGVRGKNHGEWGNPHQVELLFDWREHEPIPFVSLFDNARKSALFLFLLAGLLSRCLIQIPVSSSSMTIPQVGATECTPPRQAIPRQAIPRRARERIWTPQPRQVQQPVQVQQPLQEQGLVQVPQQPLRIQH